MPDKYTKLLIHGNSDRPDLTLSNDCIITTEQKIIGAHSVKFVSSDAPTVEWADSSDWNLGTNDWTMEGWYRFTATGNQAIWGQVASDANRYQLHVKDGVLNFYSIVDATSTIIDYRYNWSYSIDTWYHVAVVRSGTSLFLFIDGNLTSWTTVANSISNQTIGDISSPFRLGYTRASSADLYMNGYVDGFRFSNGIARYTASFTPETDRFDSDQYTKILFYADDLADVSDSKHNLFVTTDTAFKSGKFNNCPFFDGTNSLYTEPSSDWDIGSQDFTIEFWLKPHSIYHKDLIGYYSNNSNFWKIYWTYDNKILKFVNKEGGNNTIYVYGTYDFQATEWYHIAFCRNGSNFKMFVNGTQLFSQNDSSPLYYSEDVGIIKIGYVDSYHSTGYIDEIKLSVGIARYNQDFTAPTRPEADLKISGTMSKAGKVYVIDETTSVLERVAEFNSGGYDFVYVSSGRKLITARADDDGEAKAVGDIIPVTLSGSELFVDRFIGTDGNSPDTTNWTAVGPGTNLINNNKLRQSVSGSTTAIASVTYKTSLSSNFDTEVEFSFPSMPTDVYYEAGILCTDGANSFGIKRTYDTSYKVYRAFCNGNLLDATTTDTSGKFRLARFGNTIHTYYWDGSNWVELRDHTEDGSGVMEIRLFLSSGNTYPTVSVDWDNFIRYAVL